MAAQLSLVAIPMPVLLPKKFLTYQHLKEAAEKAFGYVIVSWVVSSLIIFHFSRFANLPTEDEQWWRRDTGRY